MGNETEKRIEKLEAEVRELRLELNELRGKDNSIHNAEILAGEMPSPKITREEDDHSIKLIKSENQTEELPTIKKTREEESHLVKLNKAETQSFQTTSAKAGFEEENHLVKLNRVASTKNEPMISRTNDEVELDQTKTPQKQRSFEEIILWLLPKVFMLILVLGVLWGLKVISDIGLFSNVLKIVLAYCLSVGLIITATLMDQKRPESSQIFTIVLYGGAFIIGILTTAAGAILYEVIGLYLSLLLALVYIAYGIAICYVKKNEVLSIFVIFTSLLLPYLLEYMDFNGMIILLYILLVYGSMQVIFIKHVQSIAMYISYFFSITAVQIVWGLNDDNAPLYVLSCILLNVILLLVWWHFYKPLSKFRTIHEGLLFSLSGLTVLMINVIADDSALPLLLMAVIYGSLALFAYRRSELRVVDIAGTLALLIVFNIIMVINAIDHLEMILLPLSAFLGLMVSLRLGAKLMKITYTVLFSFFVMIHLLFEEIEPFWTLEHLNHLFIFMYLIALFIYLKKRSKVKLSDDGKAQLNFTLDIFPILLATYFFYYVFKFDITYLSNDNHAYLTALVLAFVMLVSLFVSEKIIGRGLRYILIFAFLLSFITLIPTHFVEGLDIWLNLIVRVIYTLILLAIVADIYMQGYLYRTWISQLKVDVEVLLIVGILGSTLLGYSILSQTLFDGLISSLLVVTGKTLLLFLTASLSLWMSTTGSYRKVKIMGYCILAVAIFKLVFSDLASLNLIIRAILFMIIGGLGLFLSNRLLSSNNEKK
ncbi:DUF2339 domain-containing protein [Ureibacillus sinduriensis]|uniref:DUF2339 domain-containing protein n=1 Tax=Ureibacillus sinduriensis TaxID=561440 RepID=UPI00069062EF|nr:DUF2339 domain-containing protein [Ureibacillus sinduriensis]